MSTSSSSPMADVPTRPRFAPLLRAESWIMAALQGIAAMAVMLLLALVIISIVADLATPIAIRIAAVLAGAGVIAMDAWFVLSLRRHWNDHPVALSVASSWPMLPWPLRPLAGIAWLAHALIGAVLLWEAEIHHGSTGFEWGLLRWLVGAASASAAVGFILLAAASVARKPLLLERLWRLRLVTILLLLMAVAAMPHAGFISLPRPELVLFAAEAKPVVGLGEDVVILIHARNAGRTPVRLLKDGIETAIHVEIVGPDGARYERDPPRWLDTIRVNPGSYADLGAGDARALGSLRIRAADGWRHAAGPSGSPPLSRPGRYHLTVEYEDRGGVNFGAVTGGRGLHASILVTGSEDD